jgi:hypothetical protein
MGYGSLRESLDYLRNDLNFFLKEIFPANTSIDVRYHIAPNVRLTKLVDNLSSDQTGLLIRQFRKLGILIVLFGILSIAFSLIAIYEVTNDQESKASEHYIREIVRKEIDDQNSRKVNEELLKLLSDFKKDTSYKFR